MSNQRHNFTLLEILVAVAVLVIMMGFLFQFVISAQRVWAAAEGRTYMSNQTASPVLQIINEDFRHIVTYAEDDELKEFNDKNVSNDLKYVEWHNDTNNLYFFITNFNEDDPTNADSGKLCAVWYHFDDTNKNLYRTVKKDVPIQGFEASHLPTSNMMYTAFGFSTTTPINGDVLVEENLDDWDVQTYSNSSPGRESYEVPQMVRVTFRVKIPQELSNGVKNDNDGSNGQPVTRRTFSYAFFPNGK